MTHGTALRGLGALLGLVGALALSGCLYGPGYVHHDRVVVVGGEPHPGPPDHAPAHGYRRKYGYHYTQSHKRPAPRPAVELVFDADLGVHVVVGYAGVYFHADHYYRLGDAGWEWTAQLGQAWAAAPDHGVPTGLRKLRNAKGPKKPKRERHGQSDPAPAKAAPPEHRHSHGEHPGQGWH